jgi:phytoene dehydrogenase-like protein
VGEPDAVVVGSGPNGLAGALTLARAGLRVTVIEGAADPGGGCRTHALTLPGFVNDVCSAVHPLAAGSPFFHSLDLAGRGVRLLVPKVAVAHPLDGGRAAAIAGSVGHTAGSLGADAGLYRRLMAPLVRDSEAVLGLALAPLRLEALQALLPGPGLVGSVAAGLLAAESRAAELAAAPRAARAQVGPGRLMSAVLFGTEGLLPATVLARRLRTPEGRALVAGMAAHSIRPLSAPLTGAFGLTLMMLAHTTGWPVVEGGSGELVKAMIAELTERGGSVVTGQWVERLDELPRARVVLLDVTPRQLLALARDRLPAGYGRAMRRFRYGPGVCKVDWALAGPVPWLAAECRDAGTVHVGGTLAEVAASEAQVNAGQHPDRPFCLVSQPGVVDPSRAPAGQASLWGYCHVPSGSDRDISDRIEAQIERFAPGFRDLILARSVRTAKDLERDNPGYVGGDITAGAGTIRQTVGRPVLRWNQYRTPLPGVYLCSASTPPGAGVHGMCGFWAARTALADLGR